MQGNVIFSNELARRYGDSGIISISLNPGNLSTDLQRSTPKVAKFIIVSAHENLGLQIAIQ